MPAIRTSARSKREKGRGPFRTVFGRRQSPRGGEQLVGRRRGRRYSLISYFCSIAAEDEKRGTSNYAAALQRSEALGSKAAAWQDPYYWATFTLIGPQ